MRIAKIKLVLERLTESTEPDQTDANSISVQSCADIRGAGIDAIRSSAVKQGRHRVRALSSDMARHVGPHRVCYFCSERFLRLAGLEARGVSVRGRGDCG